jgi:hypothetical protein
MAMLGGLIVQLFSGGYVFVYLHRWEWNRAMFAGILFIATEVALATAVLLERKRALAADMTPARRPDPAVVRRIEEAGSPPRDPFAWLSPRRGEMDEFVPFSWAQAWCSRP